MKDNDTFLRFKKLLKFVFKNKYSGFYRHKYERAGFNPFLDFKSIDDIKKIPFLTKEELMITEPQKRLFVGENKVDYVNSTSGTTGDPALIFYSSAISNIPYPNDSLNFGKMLILRPPLKIYLSYYRVTRDYRVKTSRILAGDIHNLPPSLKLASLLKINSIFTTPTLSIILKDYLDQYSELENSLKFLLLGGEPVSPYKKRVLRELYPNLKIFLVYGTAEAGEPLGEQCVFLSQRDDQIYYHPISNIAHFEIIDPATENEVEMGKEGELVITGFRNRAGPLIRYKTGDLARFKENNCPCAYPGPLLQVLGRTKLDIVKVGGFELREEMLEKPILNLKDCLKESFEAHFYENFIGNKPRVKVVLNLSLKRGIKETSELKKKIEDELLENWWFSPRLNLKKAVEVGLFESPQINFVQFPLSAKARRALILH